MSSGTIVCRLYMGFSNGLLPPQGENGNFNVIDEMALTAVDRGHPHFQYMPASSLARESFSDQNYTHREFVERFIKPVHVSNGIFDSVTYPAVSNEFVKAVSDSGNAPRILGQATGTMLNATSLNEGMGRVQEEMNIGISISKDPASLLGWILSQYFMIMVWLPPNCCYIPTPVEGKLIERPLAPTELLAKDKIMGWLGEII